MPDAGAILGRSILWNSLVCGGAVSCSCEVEGVPFPLLTFELRLRSGHESPVDGGWSRSEEVEVEPTIQRRRKGPSSNCEDRLARNLMEHMLLHLHRRGLFSSWTRFEVVAEEIRNYWTQVGKASRGRDPHSRQFAVLG